MNIKNNEYLKAATSNLRKKITNNNSQYCCLATHSTVTDTWRRKVNSPTTHPSEVFTIVYKSSHTNGHLPIWDALSFFRSDNVILMLGNSIWKI